MARYTLSAFDRHSWRAAVQLVKDLTGSTLLEARRRVNAQEDVIVELEPSRAAWLAQRIVDERIELDSTPRLPKPALSSDPAPILGPGQAWVREFATPEGRMLIAYAPEHPEGAQQPLIRAHWEGGEERWVVIERGRFGEWEVHEDPREVDDTEAVLDALAERWRARGLRIAEDPVEIIRHFSAHNSDLERSIRRAGPNSHDAREVYLDWLVEQGDPRGRIGQLEHARARTDLERVILDAEIDALVRRHAQHLALPVTAFDGLGSSWALRLRADDERGAPHWERTLQLPVFACLRALSLSGFTSRRSPPIHFDLDMERLEGLEYLACADVVPREALAFPHLRHLILDHHGFERLVDARLPALQTLKLVADHMEPGEPGFVAALRNLQSSPIERLCLYFGRMDDARLILASITAAMRLPALRELSMVALADPDPTVEDPWREVVAELPSIPGLAGLDDLGFGEPDTDERESLEAALREAQGESPRIVCRPHPPGYRHIDPMRRPRGYAPEPMGHMLHIERDARGRVHIASRPM